MTKGSKSSLKSQNLKWLGGLAAIDTAVILYFIAPDFINAVEIGKLAKLAIARGLVTAALPVLIMLITGALSHNVKAALVFWRVRNVLPGCRVFTQYGPADVRIDMAALRKNVGELPTDPAEQNVKWYKLYQSVKSDESVVEAHRMFLLFRDASAMSLLLVLPTSIGLYLSNASFGSISIAAGIILAQYLLSVPAARNSGVRLVCNVLAIHSTRKVTNPKAAPQ
jgi:hypothetical protein